MVDIRTNTFRAIHRTYLERDGSRKILRGAAKMMYASTTGACIKLTPDEDVTQGLGICEGIETGLSLISIGWRSVWAVGSARAIEAFPVLSGVEHLTVFADCDDVGINSARVCAQRWRAMRRETRVIYPRGADEDWNDVVRQRDGLSATVQAGTPL